MAQFLSISPNHTSDYLSNPTIEKVIDVFESMILGWYINQAKNVRKNAHSDFAAISIITSLIEGIHKYRNGITVHQNSTKYLKLGIKEVFPEIHWTDDMLNGFASAVRHTQYHIGIPGIGFILDKNVDIITVSANPFEVRTDPRQFIERIETYFLDYIKELRDKKNQSLRKNLVVVLNSTYLKNKLIGLI